MAAVTAVPIRPLARGAVLKLWVGLVLLALAAAGLAWWGTRALQMVTLESGVRYRVMQAGTGPLMTAADVVALRYKLRVGSPGARVIQDSDETGRPLVATTADVFPGFAEGLQQMQAGGRYWLWLPPGQHASGPFPPDAPFQAGDTLVFEIQVLQIGAGQASAYQMQRLQEMMQQQQMQQQSGPGAGAPPGAAPPPGGGSGGRPGGR